MNFKKTIVALLSVCSCLMAMASDVTGSRIRLLHLYDWNEVSYGQVTIGESDPFYYGGWTVNLIAGEEAGQVIAQGGITMYEVPQPLMIDEARGTVTLVASEEPFATLSGTKTTVSGNVTTTVDSVQRFYIVNEEWVLQTGDVADVVGEILPDGTIHIGPGFAYYIETERTTTITSGSSSRTFTDENVDVSRIFRDTWLVKPNGKHSYVPQATGVAVENDVYMYQSNDTVHVMNLYGFGGPEAIMILHEDGTMSYPGQPLRDIPNGMSPTGAGMWYNATVSDGSAVAGNEGNVTPAAITWGLTTPWDNVTTWEGWSDNRLYFTDGTEFVIGTPQPEFQLGDVDHNGTVDIEDVTKLISYVLGNNPSGFYNDVANCDGQGAIDIEDVTALIGRVLGGTW